MGLKVWLDASRTPPKGWTQIKTLPEFDDVLHDSDIEIKQISLDASFCDDGAGAAKMIEDAAESGHLGFSILAIHASSNDPSVNSIIKQSFQAANFAWESLGED